MLPHLRLDIQHFRNWISSKSAHPVFENVIALDKCPFIYISCGFALFLYLLAYRGIYLSSCSLYFLMHCSECSPNSISHCLLMQIGIKVSSITKSIYICHFYHYCLNLFSFLTFFKLHQQNKLTMNMMIICGQYNCVN